MTRRRRQSLVAVAIVLAIVASLGATVTLTGARVPSQLNAQRPDLGEGEGELQQREQWFYGQREYPGDSIPAGAYAQARAEAEQVVSTDVVTPTALEWTELGPHSITSYTSDYFTVYPYYGSAPLAGRVSAIATHPTNENVAYVGGATGGVWKTTDDGVTWDPLFDQEAAAIAIGAIAIDPVTPTTVYAGTGEANFASDSYFGTGVYKSTNGGAEGSWTKLNGSVFDNCYVSDIVVKPGDSDTVLIAVHDSGSTTTTCARGVYRSINATTATPTWTRVTSRCRPTDLAVDTSDPAIWYGGFRSADTTRCGVYKSVDSGETWIEFSTGIPEAGRARIALTVNDQRLYAAISNTGNQPLGGTLWTSADAGGSWSSIPTASDFCDLGSGGQCNYDLAIAVSPSDATDFYAGGVKLFKYTGDEIVAPPPVGYCDNPCTPNANDTHVDVHVLTYDSSGRLWIGNDGGVYRTTDGVTFANLNTDLNLIQFYPGTSGSVAGPFVGGAQDNGVAKFSGNLEWGGLLGADGGFSAVDPTNPNVIYGTTQYLNIYKSTNGGLAVVPKVGGIPNCGAPSWKACQAGFIAPLVMDPSTPLVLYAGTDLVWKTTNGAEGGSAWSAISPSFGASISAIAPAPSSSSTLYAGTEDGQLQVTTNGGTNWLDEAAAPLPNRSMTDIAVHDTSAGEAYVTVSGFNASTPATPGHIFKTTNFGDTWSDISGNLPNSPANAVVVDTRTAPVTLYVGTDVGVFWSAGGTTWISANTGLPNTVVSDLVLDKQADQLIAATHGRGAFTAPVVPLPTSGSKVAFVSNRGGDEEIFVMSSNGASQTNLTKNTVKDWDPAWSPDRTKIAFTSNRDGNYEIYVMDADGSNVVRLTNDPDTDQYPTWSGNGAQIAFDSDTDGDREIFKMNANGTARTQLTFNTVVDGYPSWSPTASVIAFHSNGGGDYEIIKMNADGSNPTPLTSNTVNDFEPSWSNDGTKITFDSNLDGDYEIFTMTSTGSAQTPVTSNTSVDEYPSWSADDTQLTFTSNRDGNKNVFKMASTGGAATRLTSDAGTDLDPSWEPSAPTATLPGAPTGVSATAGNALATVSWTAPVSNGGSTITNYIVTPFIGAVAQTPTQVGAVTSTPITGLTNGTSYTFKVAAVNGVGTGPQSAASNAVTPQAPPPGTRTASDYDGDGDADLAIYRPSEGFWYIRGQESAWAQWGGQRGDVPVPGDYDNDGDTDIAIYRPSDGFWYIRGQESKWAQWGGQSGDVPVPGDYNDDGFSDLAIYRPSENRWYVRGQFELTLGQAGDIPVPGDYDGDGSTEAAVFRPSTGTWLIDGLSPVTNWGVPGDIPVVADYDDDGDADPALYRPADAFWYVKDQPPYLSWGGIAADVPVPADYDVGVDAKADITIYRPSEGFWYIRGQPSTWANWGGQAGDVVVNVPPAIWLTFFS